jgi:hypothetical protein
MEPLILMYFKNILILIKGKLHEYLLVIHMLYFKFFSVKRLQKKNLICFSMHQMF